MNCQARVTDVEMEFATLGEKYFTTKECGADIIKIKMVVDDGESKMNICNACMKRFIGRAKKPEEWYGWFDCEYPPGARVKYSGWWREMSKKEAGAALAGSGPEEEEDLLETLVAPMQAVAIVSEADQLKQKIAEVDAWLKENAKKVKGKEVLKMHKHLIDLRAQLNIIRRA
jgi:hypothetical protein